MIIFFLFIYLYLIVGKERLAKTTSQIGGVGKLASLPHTTTSKLQKKPMEQASLTIVRNQAEWKSNKYGIKEASSIQTSRRVDMWRHGKGCSHTHMWWVKIWEGYLVSEGFHLHTRSLSPGFQCQEDKSP